MGTGMLGDSEKTMEQLKNQKIPKIQMLRLHG